MPIKVKQKHGWAINRFQKWDVGNPLGRPRKMLTQLKDDFLRLWVGKITSMNIQEVYELLFWLDKEALLKIANDDNMPIFIQIMAHGLTQKNRGISSLELMLDRVHGKPKQKIESDLLPITNVTLTLKLNGRNQSKPGNIASIPKELSEPQAH